MPSISNLQLIAQERRVSFELENIAKTDVAALEEFVAKYSAVLNPRHSLVVSAKQNLSVAYGRSKKCSSEREKRRKVELCREVLETMRLLETGIATRIGKEDIALHWDDGLLSAIPRSRGSKIWLSRSFCCSSFLGLDT